MKVGKDNGLGSNLDKEGYSDGDDSENDDTHDKNDDDECNIKEFSYGDDYEEINRNTSKNKNKNVHSSSFTGNKKVTNTKVVKNIKKKLIKLVIKRHKKMKK